MKRLLLLSFLTAPLFTHLVAQVDSYILKRQIFKVPLTSLNIPPDGKKLMGGFNDGSFRILDSESFKTSLEVRQAHPKAVNAMDMPAKMGNMQFHPRSIKPLFCGIYTTVKCWSA